jgi:hypothetical protein
MKYYTFKNILNTETYLRLAISIWQHQSQVHKWPQEQDIALYCQGLEKLIITCDKSVNKSSDIVAK